MNDVRRRRRRRLCASVAFALGLVDIVQAASRHSIARLGWISLHLGGSTTRLFRYVLLLAALTLLSTTRGLLRGKRTAWVLAVVAASASSVGHHVVKADALGITLALGVITVLLVCSAQFRAKPDPALTRQAIGWIATGLVGTYTYGVGGLYLLDSQFRRSTTVSQSFGQSARLLFLLPVSTIKPVTHHGEWFVDSVRVLVVAILLIGIVGLLRPVAARAPHQRDLDHVRDLLQRYADTSLAYFHLLPDKHQLFAPDREAFIGYKVVGAVAVSLGGPIGAPDSQRDAVTLFLERCELNGWVPAFHQTTPVAVELLAEFGLKALKIGEEAVIDVQEFALTGSHFKSIRSKTGKMEREGWTVTTLGSPIDDATMRRLREVSDSWLADAGHRERTFTLGQFDEDYLRSTTVLVCRDPAGKIQGFTNVIPQYQSRDGNFDLMRRSPDTNLPVMDLLFVKMIERMRVDGLNGMTLGLAPFANVDGDTVADRALRMLYQHGSRAFNFTGLRTFKDKWRPRWEPRYLMYRSDAELPAIAYGVSRAGELEFADSTRLEAASGRVGAVARAVHRTARRIPFTTLITTAILAFQIATVFDRDEYSGLVASLHYNWDDLAQNGRIYRLFTALFLQDGPGFRVGTLAILPLLAVAEFVLGSRRTAVAFFVGDVASSVPILLVVRFLASAGVTAAARAVTERDGGVSSAIFAAITAGALAIKHPRWRRSLVSALVAGMTLDTVIQHRLFNVQHFAAALVGAACSYWWFGRKSQSTAEQQRL